MGVLSRRVVREYYAAAPFEAGFSLVTIGGEAMANMLHQEYELQCNLRRTVIWALGRLGDPLAAPILRQALTDRSSMVRAAATEALTNLVEGRQLLAAAD